MEGLTPESMLHQKFDDAYTDRGHGPGPIWLRLVGSSIENGYTGEAILMLTEPLMYASAGQISPQGTANIVAGLRYIGLQEDATSLALEAVLQADKSMY